MDEWTDGQIGGWMDGWIGWKLFPIICRRDRRTRLLSELNAARFLINYHGSQSLNEPLNEPLTCDKWV